ncbi:Zn-dependent M28 family amino/carboxypeptidase [Dyadobacter jejuensis]|uniref:Zn-dependent M28 family amino/carboxypeptidase n=1 Tax=Dyadobacter jejuensis TaxID=1082580 RepID=A0A316AIQ7_9BACT|nr:M28 family peptidase [Dyadobacter jejuensis]PWJ57675.1 Zn-dependent M28 family amino/carboxypeptidase [Dyadobacter jejuensis]
MNKHLLAGLLLTVGTIAMGQDQATKYAETISPSDLKKHLTIIASDSLEGRDTGSPGQKKAAEYVVKYYKEYGLEPIAVDANGQKSFYQKYQLYKRSWGEVSLTAAGQRYEMGQDFFVNGLANIPEEITVPVVFAGYGIADERYSDYADLDVKGKAVVVFEGEPQDKLGKYLVTGTDEKSKWSSNIAWQHKVRIARSNGAKYVLIVTDKTGDDVQKEIRQRAVMARRFGAPTLKPVVEADDALSAWVISDAIAAKVLHTSIKKLNANKKAITKAGKSTLRSLKGEIALKAERINETIDTENVAAYLEGSDKKDEVLVISAHIDHIGISPNGEINNGADDDGSGTVSLMELAQAFAKAKAEGHGPRRSILFLNVTGEEKGLFGSEYYSKNPLLPLENTIANLNIDMIGRVDAAHENNHEYVYLIGSDKLSSELHAVSEEANKKYVNFDLDYTFNDPNDPNRFYYRSDHYNFAKNNVPVIFYFTGVHEDYHRPGDDVEKILFDKQSKIVKLVFYTAWELVNREGRIVVDSNKK